MLAIDCGNTRIKWARYRSGKRRDTGAASLRGEADPFARLAAALDAEVDRVVVANVAGTEVAERITATVESRLGIAPRFVEVEERAHGIACGYRDPASLGVDRWLAMIAAKRSVDGPFAVVGAGTAVTFDAVDGSGRHLGGLIIPGDRLMLDALARNTGQLPVVEPAARVVAGLGLLGRSTASAMSRGTRLAAAAAVDRAAASVAEALGIPVSLVVTGGDGEALAKWLATTAEVKADLVLDGLALVADGIDGC